MKITILDFIKIPMRQLPIYSVSTLLLSSLQPFIYINLSILARAHTHVNKDIHIHTQTIYVHM